MRTSAHVSKGRSCKIWMSDLLEIKICNGRYRMAEVKGAKPTPIGKACSEMVCDDQQPRV